jgi:hypothetical protein
VTHFTGEPDQPYYRRHVQTKELVTDGCVFASGHVDISSPE